MTVYLPASLEEAFEAFELAPDADLLAGGTDYMVEVNSGHRHPSKVVALRKVGELAGWRREGDEVVLGAGLTYTDLMQPDLSELLPGLAQAARTVGSPQIRNVGTLGGNLGTASPAGDTLPVLSALDAVVVLGRRGSVRRLTMHEFVLGPKATALEPGELIVEVRVPAALGSQEFLKVGTRNAMVIAVVNVALVVDWVGRSVRCALGSVGPVPIRAGEAEAFAESRIDWAAGGLTGGAADLAEFAGLVRAAARPIDDHRSTAEYRTHAVGVCAHRALDRVLARAGSWTLGHAS